MGTWQYIVHHKENDNDNTYIEIEDLPEKLS